MNYFRQDSIISTNVNYSYNVFIKDLHKLTSLYPFISVGSIGKSIMGKDIPFIKIGNGSNEVFYSASYHANEWITSIVLMKFLADYCYCYKNNLNIYGYNARRLYSNTSIYIMPMVNPDGVDLVTGEIPKNSSLYTNTKLIANNYPQIPFPAGWKANIRGVDLKNFQPIYLEYDVVKFSMFLGIPTILQEISIKIFSQFSSKIFQIFLTKSPFTFETFQILTTFIF